VPLINASQLLLPYGVLLFALSGASAVPEIYSYFQKKSLTPKDINFLKNPSSGAALSLLCFILYFVSAP